ncbi:MAG: hypothetical protein MJ068_03600, partial [Clostridia bacterium]|nr:hypothetical protein [Clostridia bacterium]
MRAKNSVNRKYDIAKIAILVACFIFVFVATFIVCATEKDCQGDIAVAGYAEVSGVSDEEGGSVGSAEAIYLDGRTSQYTALDFGFPGTNPSTTTWTKTETLQTTAQTDKNFEAFRDGGSTAVLYIDGGVNNWTFGGKDIGRNRTTYSAINIILGNDSGFVSKFFNNSMYTLTAKVTATITVHAEANFLATNNTTTGKIGVATSGSGFSAKGVRDSSASFVWSSGKSVNANGFGSENETSSGDNYTATTQVKGQVLTLGGSFKWEHGDAVSNNNGYVKFSNIVVELKITKNSITYSSTTVKEDGGNPIVSSTLDGLAGNIDDPVPYADKIGQSAKVNKIKYGSKDYDVDLTSELSKRLDSIIDGSGSMQSYTNEIISSISVGGKNVSYYKKLQVEFVDTYNYQSQDPLALMLLNLGEDGALSREQMATVAGAGDEYVQNYDKETGVITWETASPDYASGIKTIQVGETEIDVSNIGVGNTFSALISIDDGDNATTNDTVGAVEVKKVNSARILVTYYMYRNAQVNTIVKDYGKGSCSTSVKFAGIDNEMPIANLSFSTDELNIMFTNPTVQDSAQWVRTKKLTINVSSGIGSDESDGEFYSPYVWFYTVSKGGTAVGASNNSTPHATYDDLNDYFRPIAVNDISSFVYNFETGTAEGINKGSNISGGTNATGSGYYYFTFYVCDIAGNINTANTQSFYVKADYSTPYSTTTLRTDRAESITKEINGKWADCGETLSVNLLVNNISGNTLLFDDSVTTHVLVIDAYKIISLDDTALAANSIDAIVHIIGIDSEADVYISTQPNGNGGTLIQFRILTSPYFAWETVLTMYVGMNYTEGENSSANIESVIFDAVEFGDPAT